MRKGVSASFFINQKFSGVPAVIVYRVFVPMISEGSPNPDPTGLTGKTVCSEIPAQHNDISPEKIRPYAP